MTAESILRRQRDVAEEDAATLRLELQSLRARLAVLVPDCSYPVCVVAQCCQGPCLEVAVHLYRRRKTGS